MQLVIIVLTGRPCLSTGFRCIFKKEWIKYKEWKLYRIHTKNGGDWQKTNAAKNKEAMVNCDKAGNYQPIYNHMYPISAMCPLLYDLKIVSPYTH